MSLSLESKSDGLAALITLGATLLAEISVDGIEDGVLIADDAEAQAFTNLKKLITPEKLAKAFQGSNQSLGALSSYQKLPGGLIIQIFKSTSSVAIGGGVDVAFPITFPNACVAFVPSLSSSADANDTYCAYRNLTSSGARIANGGSNTADGYSYIAIGY